MAKPSRRLHLSLPVDPPTKYQRHVARGERFLARQEALRQKQRATIDLIQHRKRGWV